MLDPNYIEVVFTNQDFKDIDDLIEHLKNAPDNNPVCQNWINILQKFKTLDKPEKVFHYIGNGNYDVSKRSFTKVYVKK